MCPSVDVTFTTIADAYGARAAGVLLTGMGTDGAAGLLAIRHAGGTTMVQDEASCVVFGMPRAAINLEAAQIDAASRTADTQGRGISRRKASCSEKVSARPRSRGSRHRYRQGMITIGAFSNTSFKSPDTMVSDLILFFVAATLLVVIVAMVRQRGNSGSRHRRARHAAGSCGSVAARSAAAWLAAAAGARRARSRRAGARGHGPSRKLIEERASPGLTAQVMPVFLKDTAARGSNALRTAVAQKDGTSAHRIAHTLHGSAATVGAASMVSSCADLIREVRCRRVRSLRRPDRRARRWTSRPFGRAAEGSTGALMTYVPRNPRRILIVDDDDATRVVTQVLVRRCGYDVETAADGIEGLAKVRLGIDLVLLDLVMPGMDGFEVCRRLRSDAD